jgi:hypothetical protein
MFRLLSVGKSEAECDINSSTELGLDVFQVSQLRRHYERLDLQVVYDTKSFANVDIERQNVQTMEKGFSRSGGRKP